MTNEAEASGPIVEEPTDTRSEADAGRVIESIDDLHALQPGAHIEVTRLVPQACKGYLGHLVVPDDGMGDIKEELKSAWGGGTFQLRAKDTHRGGRLTYVQGAARIDIAGHPRLDGKEFTNGVWRPISLTPVGNPVPMQVVPHQQPGADGVNTTLQVLTQILPMLQSNDLGGVDLPGLITAISGASGPRGNQPDGFRDMERAMGILSRMRESPMMGAEAPAAPAAAGWEQYMPMIMMKMLGGDPGAMMNPNGRPAMMPAPMGYPVPGMQPMGGQPGAQAPQQAYQYPQQAQQAGPPPAAAAPTPNWTNQPHPGQPVQVPQGSPQAVPSEPTPAPPAAAAPEGAAAADTPAEPQRPMTADDVMAELAEMPQEARMAFVADLAGKLGLPEQMATAMFPGGAPPGVAPPVAPVVEAPAVVPSYTVDLPDDGSKK